VCGIAPSVTLVSGKQTRENFEAVHRMNALERGVEVADLVAALRYLIATPVITGQTIVLDGGQRFSRCRATSNIWNNDDSSSHLDGLVPQACAALAPHLPRGL
jgi:hypothetical protein